MKLLLKFISWSIFFIMAIAAVLVVVFTFGGVMCLISRIFVPNSIAAQLVELYAVGYFSSIIVIILGCIIFSIYEWIRRRSIDRI